jgi:hypothetical protein
MTEQQILKDRPFEERVTEIDHWILAYGSEGSIGLLNPEVLKSVLSEVGANFENLDEQGRKSLSQYSNKGKHLGMEQVWGSRRAEFKTWTETWVKDYETRTGRELPKLVFKDAVTGELGVSKTEGMRQFLGELTAYAAGSINFPNLVKVLIMRHYNFDKAKNVPSEEGGRRKITFPGYNLDKVTGKEKPFAPASIPPEFPQDVWDKILSWRK